MWIKKLTAAMAMVGAALLWSGSASAQDIFGDPATGQALMIQMKCPQCHGQTGLGRSKTPGVPRIDGQYEVYLINQLFNFRDGRRPHKFMEVYAGQLNGQVVRDLAAFYACQGDSVVEDMNRCAAVR